MKRIIGIVIIAVMLVSCSKGDISSWQDQYDLGMRYLSEGNYEAAIIAFAAAIEIDSKQAPAYIGRGDAYSGMAALTEEVEEKIAWLQQAAEDYQAALELGDESAEEKLQAIQVLLEQLQDEGSRLLKPLYALFRQGNLDSAKTLMRAEEYQNLSASLAEGHYEYTEDGSEYMAVYPKNFYYFGTMESGKRSGHGLWVRAVYDADDSFESEVYEGNWDEDFPNGEGVVTTTYDIEKNTDEFYATNCVHLEIRGSFKNGLHHGTIYETWEMNNGDLIKWSPITAVEGIYQPYSGTLPEWIVGNDYHQDADGYHVAIVDGETLQLLRDYGNVHTVPGFGD